MTRRPETHDTIVAVATPPGRGALGTVRLSGPDACALSRHLFRPWHEVEPFPPARRAVSGHALALPAGGASRPGAGPMGAGPGARPPEALSRAARRASGSTVSGARAGDVTSETGCVPEAGEAVDHGVLLHFPAAESPTGEDLVEITVHGSPLVLQRLVEAAVGWGARPALPGEFTYRAFLHGRVDAVQAEAIDDLIHARTEQQARAAYQQQCGALSRAVEAPRTQLIECLARLEGSIEFAATETEDFLEPAALALALDRIRAHLQDLLASAVRGLRLQSGARVVIAGPVNAGKSSIFNRLVEFDRAIVSPVPGTTRDVIEREVEWDGWPVTLIDTAGDRDPQTLLSPADDTIEGEGQRRGLAARRDADLILWITEVGSPTAPPPREPGAPPLLCVVNKMDLVPGSGTDAGIATGVDIRTSEESGALRISALTGAGFIDLRAAAIRVLAPGADSTALPLVTRLRQKTCLERAAAALDEAITLVRCHTGEELIVIPLHRALEEFAELTGRGNLEEIYDRIFSTFCIGK